MVEKRINNNTSCDIHYFDQWGINQAYILGFIFADGSITKRMTDIVIGISSKDIEVLDYIKRETKSTRNYYKREAWTDGSNYKHTEAVFMTLASKVLVTKLMELGLRQGKTYTNDPFPNIPTEYLPHFIRGYFDGDGAVVKLPGGGISVRFIGSPKIIEGIRDALITNANMSHKDVIIETGKTKKECKWGRIIWARKEDIQKFHSYIYPTELPFALDRKRKPLNEWLTTPREKSNPHLLRWTSEEEQVVKDLYLNLGPTKIEKMINRSYTAICSKARELGIIKGKEDRVKK